jgi:glycosyltransferase involved in cell wall biosynthesis
VTSRVCAILPALDEAEALPHVLSRRPAGIRVIVVDNGSRDETAAVALAHGVEVVGEPRRGFGAACWRGVRASEDAEVLVFLDADGSLSWDDLPAVVGPVLDGRADLVIGERVRRRRAPGAMPWHAVVANRVLATFCGLLAGHRLRDLGPYRAIRRDTLLTLGMRDRTYGWPLEMLLRAGRSGLRVVEVPVSYGRRAGGRSKVSGRAWPTVKTGAKMAWVMVRHAIAADREQPW